MQYVMCIYMVSIFALSGWRCYFYFFLGFFALMSLLGSLNTHSLGIVGGSGFVSFCTLVVALVFVCVPGILG